MDGKIREIRKEDVDKVSREVIAPHQQEPDKYDFNPFKEDEETYVYEEDGEVLGVMSVIIVECKNIQDYCVLLSDCVCDFLPVDEDECVGFLESGYVEQSHTGRSIGTRLLNNLERVANDMDVACVVTEAWVHGGDDSPYKILEGSGYERLGAPSNFFEGDWVEDFGKCVKCDGKCECRVVMYYKLL